MSDAELHIRFGHGTQPGTVTVVSVEERVAAEEARDQAQAARDQAQAAAGTFTAPADAVIAGLVGSGVTLTGAALAGMFTDEETRADAAYAPATGSEVYATKDEIVSGSQVPGSRHVFMGDSITIGGELKKEHGGTSEKSVSRSWPGYAAWMSEGKVFHTYNAAMAGEQSYQMLARFDADVLVHEPHTVTLMAGTNDMSAGRDVALWQADMRAMVEKIRGAGAVPIILSLPPRDDVDSYRFEVPKRNQWLRYWCDAAGIPYVDVYHVLVDPVTAKYKTAYNLDNVHPNEAGMKAIAEEYLRVVGPLLQPSYPGLVVSTAESGTMIGNGTFASTATPPPASVAVGSGSVAVTYENAVAPAAGRWAVLTVSGDAGPAPWGPTTGVEWTFSTGFTPGDLIYFGSRFSSAGAQTTIRITYVGSGFTGYPLWKCITPTAGLVQDFLRVPPGTTAIKIALLGATGVHKFAQFTVRNLTVLGIDN